eukprot:CAMPEP_0195512594 /NCGR_PEP_ID=MMETSP0794_2-20130614/4506_1 /TAXON_ID=515487 /ORGANISM="Stephanopyxis turris, Strain CCMP 815" /LENGTH=190 /DNA_ID=CAMNT_0040640417 /DNA_START=81 /DNA_END=653 /DNA_ORIENTATION=+
MVTDAYGVIKNERSRVVFWTTRLDFASEMQMVKSFRCINGISGHNRARQDNNDQNEESAEILGKELWTQLVELYENKHLSASVEFFFVSACRLMALLVIPLWLLIGFFPTAGLLWPPQVRQWLLHQKINNDSSRTLEERKLAQIAELRAEVLKLQEDVKVEIVTMKADIKAEMTQMKELISLLIDTMSAK